MKRVVPLLFLVAMACASTPSNVRLPVIIKDVDPYLDGVAGATFNTDVRVEGTVGIDGHLYDAQVLSQVPPEIQLAALEAAEAFVFRPGTIDGHPEEMKFKFSVRFRRRGEHW